MSAFGGKADSGRSFSIANPHPVPTESRWHPTPATADADSGGEQVSGPEVMNVCEMVPVPEVIKVMKVSEVSEAVSWKVRATTERMYAPRSAGHAEAVHPAEAVHAARAVHATKTAHRVGGQRHWRGQHRQHDSTSDCYFAEHDNPPDCHKLPRRHTVRPQCRMFK
jgi:hypothetical protein